MATECLQIIRTITKEYSNYGIVIAARQVQPHRCWIITINDR